MITRSQIENAIKDYRDPYLNLDLIAARAIKDIRMTDNSVSLDIVLGYPANSVRESIIAALKKILLALPDVAEVNINLSWKIEAHVAQHGIQSVPQVRNIIAIASGKGGVGKSTTAVNLALALHLEGASVGILDADIYGPNQPHMLGVTDQPNIKAEKGLNPVMNHGIQSISIGYLIDVNTPMVWRGPMVSQALQQLLHETHWRDLDYLIVDLPPGTGDVQLTLSQRIPVSGAVMVTTPQDIALLDVRKGLEMFRKVRVPILGVIENMSFHVCTQCGNQEFIFGKEGATKIAEATNIELLGQLPLNIQIREDVDKGVPSVVADPNSNIAGIYREIARKVAAKLSLQGKNFAAKFPKIVIED